MELEPRDGCGREAARGRDADQLCELVRHRIALEGVDDPRRDDEDRGHGGKRELEARIEQRVGVPAEEEGCADEQRLPPVALAGGQPGERPERGGQRRPHNGRMKPDREGVRSDAEQRRDLGEVASEACEQAERGYATADRSDLQAVHG